MSIFSLVGRRSVVNIVPRVLSFDHNSLVLKVDPLIILLDFCNILTRSLSGSFVLIVARRRSVVEH